MPYKDHEAARAAKHAYYLAHREESLARSAQWRKDHPEKARQIVKRSKHKHADKVRAYNHAYNTTHPEVFRASAKRQREQHPEAVKAKNARSRAKRREANNAYNKTYYQANKEAIKRHHQSTAYREHQATYMATLRAANPEQMRVLKRQQYAANPQKYTAYSKRRRARLYEAEVRLTHTQWLLIQEHQHHRCYYCGTRCKGRLTQDHITPLSKGGAHTLHNVVAACKSCNSRKNAGPPPIPVQPLLL